MRFLVFLIFAAAITCIQATLGPRLEIAGIRPDLVMGFVVFGALYATRQRAIAGAWIIGLLADLFTLERLGFLTASYTLAALLILLIRPYVYRHLAATQFLMALAATMLVRSLWCAYRGFAYDFPGWMGGHLAAELLLATLYTAVAAMLLTQLLMPIAHWFGFRRPKYRHRGMEFART